MQECERFTVCISSRSSSVSQDLIAFGSQSSERPVAERLFPRSPCSRLDSAVPQHSSPELRGYGFASTMQRLPVNPCKSIFGDLNFIETLNSGSHGCYMLQDKFLFYIA